MNSVRQILQYEMLYWPMLVALLRIESDSAGWSIILWCRQLNISLPLLVCRKLFFFMTC